MDIALTARNFELDRDIKLHVRKRLKKAEKLYKRIYKCDVVLEQEKDHVNAEIIIHLKRNKIVAKESSQDVFSSIDLASHKIATQLRRLRGKISSRARRKVMRKIASPVFGPAEKEIFPQAGKIVNVDTFAEKPMLPEEACAELDVRGWDFLLFSNADTSETSLIYRRKDGSYGLVEPGF